MANEHGCLISTLIHDQHLLNKFYFKVYLRIPRAKILIKPKAEVGAILWQGLSLEVTSIQKQPPRSVL